jgi:hypothetical protein
LSRRIAATLSHPMSDEQPVTSWCHNPRFHIITHEPRTCETCTYWTVHYLEHIAAGEPSLEEAERACNTAIIGSIIDERDSLLASIVELRNQVHTLNLTLQECNKQKDRAIAQVTELTEQMANSQGERPRKLPRRDPSPCTSVHSELTIGGCETPHPVSAPPQLLSRIQLRGPPGSPIAAPTLTPAQDLITPSSPPGFPALLPIILCRPDNSLCAPNDDIPAFPDGQLDFNAYSRYVYATGSMTPDGVPNFQTTLVWSGTFYAPGAIAARKAGGRIPLVGLVLGGRNGVLISPVKDPRTQSEVDTLLNTPERTGFARGYAERIRLTPPELRGTLHSRALERWDNLQMHASPADRREPMPTTHINIWKRWLYRKHSADPHFRYTGIPFVGKGFQTAHIEGTRALLIFLPWNFNGSAIHRGPLRTHFLSVAAALLGVPQRYEQLITQERLLIHQTRRSEPYEEEVFGTAPKLGIRSVARFLAWNGVPPEEAEQWRPWATAYIEMSLSDHPDSARAPILKQARDLARQCITDHPEFILKSVHMDAPGNYNPALEQSREARSLQPASCEETADITRPMTPPDFAYTHIDHPDEEETTHNGWDDDNISMGPG